MFSKLVILFFVILIPLTAVQAQTTNNQTDFTYQGYLELNGLPVTGTCNFTFSVYNTLTTGTQIGTTQTVSTLPVTEGVFSTQLDFGVGAFNGQDRWLEIAVNNCAGGAIFTTLTPRQAITPAAYALYSTTAWNLGGNNGTVAGSNFIGTSDNQALDFRVNGARAFRIEPNATSPNIVAGYVGNNVIAGALGATISGGGSNTSMNSITDNYGTIGGGANNQAGDNSGTILDREAATVGGGWGNVASGHRSTISGGYYNVAGGFYSSVGGGDSNVAYGHNSTISGGQDNQANADHAVIGGGFNNVISGNISTVGGGYYNSVTAQYGTIAGGGDGLAVNGNRVTDNYGTVGGGGNNQAGDAFGSLSDRQGATVGGGWGNIASGHRSTISGGYYNIAGGFYSSVGGGDSNVANGHNSTISGGQDNQANADHAVIGGGFNNVISANISTVGGGYYNKIIAQYGTIGGGGSVTPSEANLVTDNYGTIGGGANNQAGDDFGMLNDREYATVAGGWSNTASGISSTVSGGAFNISSGDYSTVSGGDHNIASSIYSTVSGGANNTASGNYSFAAGYSAKATNSGSFVWADVSGGDFTSTASNQFNIRATGGVRIYTHSGLIAGVTLDPGGGTWNNVSDRNAKEDFMDIDSRQVLEAVVNMPVTSWEYIDTDTRHIGPVAQDFYAAFGVGSGETTISTVDADGVALAAIQGLNLKLQDRDAQISTQQSQITGLQTQTTLLMLVVAGLALMVFKNNRQSINSAKSVGKA